LYLKRDDLVHPEIPGNKWRKLKYNLSTARDQGYSRLLTFGGAYSNHIRATAAAGHYLGFSTLGVIRGEEHAPLNWSLSYAVDLGMRLSYMDRATYRRKDARDVIAGLREKYGNFYLLPEGGSNALAVRGCAEIPAELGIEFDVICCPVGTGGTLAGIASGLSSEQRALGVAVLKGGQFLTNKVAELQRQEYAAVSANWWIECDFHFGGFAKSTPELHGFIDDFERRHGLRLDWIYVAKMMYGVFELVAQGAFAPESVIVAVVTGLADSERCHALR
jgi:1-aminocyclopropane-1-carboxylate deaminase/D-cysteine desulfhydrase-like pyridoxal-dependent ACC family enzyme